MPPLAGGVEVLLLVILLALIIAVLFGLRKIFGNSGGKDALDIARERYARDEISRDEFERMRRDLGQ